MGISRHIKFEENRIKKIYEVEDVINSSLSKGILVLIFIGIMFVCFMLGRNSGKNEIYNNICLSTKK